MVTLAALSGNLGSFGWCLGGWVIIIVDGWFGGFGVD